MALLHSLLDSFYGPCRYITVLGDSLTRRDSWKQSAAQGDTGWPEEALPAGLRVEDSLLCVPLASQRLRRGTLSLISLLHTIQISPMPSCCWGFPVPLKPRSSCKTPTTVSQDREGVLGHFREMLGVGQRNGWHTTPDTAETFIGLLRPCSVLQPPRPHIPFSCHLPLGSLSWLLEVWRGCLEPRAPQLLSSPSVI